MRTLLPGPTSQTIIFLYACMTACDVIIKEMEVSTVWGAWKRLAWNDGYLRLASYSSTAQVL